MKSSGICIHMSSIAAVNNPNPVRAQPHIQGNCERKNISSTIVGIRLKFIGKTTNKQAALERMDFFEEFQTWSCHRLYGNGWSWFIHKSWKESMHTPHMEVFFPEPDPHGSIIIRSSMACSEMREVGGLWFTVPDRNDFLDSAIWWRERNTALSQALLLTWRQLRQTGLFSCTAVEMNHRNSYPGFSSLSVSSAGHAACPLTLILIIISFSAALPSWWLEALKVLLGVAREKKALMVQYICQALTFKYLCPPLQN